MQDGTIKGLSKNNYENSLNFQISCDWLQIHVAFKGKFSESPCVKYHLKRTGQSKIFRSIYAINNILGEQVAELACDASECILKPDHAILKIDNKQLYVNADIESFVMELLKDLNYQFVGITRYDVAYDFQGFDNGLSCEDFIKQYIGNKFVKVRNTKFKIDGKDVACKKEFSYIGFGSPTSIVTYKLYNKTLEQNEVRQKNYIFDKHKKTFQDGREIWRLEFSIKSNTREFKDNFWKDKNNDLKISFHNLRMCSPRNTHMIFGYCYTQYFRFVLFDGKHTRKERMKPLHLITLSGFQGFEPCKETECKKDATRAIKIFAKKLHLLQEEFKEYDSDIAGQSKIILSKVIPLHGLELWAKSKMISFGETRKYIAEITDKKIEVSAIKLLEKRKFLDQQNRRDLRAEPEFKLIK